MKVRANDPGPKQIFTVVSDQVRNGARSGKDFRKAADLYNSPGTEALWNAYGLKDWKTSFRNYYRKEIKTQLQGK